MKRLPNKVCVITGGAGGIGYASVLCFLAEGAKVVLADLNEEAGMQKVKEIDGRGDLERVRFYPCDVSDEAQVIRMVRFTVQEFGRIDCLFNNAGLGGAFGPLTEIRIQDWNRTMALILRSTFVCIKHAARAMIKQNKGGSIVNNASIAGTLGGQAGAAYAAAKAGVINLTKTAAIQLAEHKIRVNSLSPGTIATPLIHRNIDVEEFHQLASKYQAWPETGMPEHVATVAAFLASDDARFMTGENVFVDGGIVAGGPHLYRGDHPGGNAIADRMQKAGTQRFDYGNTGLTE